MLIFISKLVLDNTQLILLFHSSYVIVLFCLILYGLLADKWARGSWSLCLSCMCLLAMHRLICFSFFLPPGVRVGCDFCVWLFLDFSFYLMTTSENLKVVHIL